MCLESHVEMTIFWIYSLNKTLLKLTSCFFLLSKMQLLENVKVWICFTLYSCQTVGFWVILKLCMDWYHLVIRELQFIFYSSRLFFPDHRVLYSMPQALKGFLTPGYCSGCFSLPFTLIHLFSQNVPQNQVPALTTQDSWFLMTLVFGSQPICLLGTWIPVYILNKV